MLLAVDIGNTNTGIALFKTGSGASTSDPIASWRTRTIHDMTADELAMQTRSLVSRFTEGSEQISSTVIASVVPAQTIEWVESIEATFGHEPLVLGPGVKTGMKILIDDPREVGADRIAGAVAAWAQFGRACIVVDLGTATTLDVVSSEGHYRGGAIAPGIDVSLQALVGRAAKLSEIDLIPPKRALGASTVECMRSGVILGAASMIDGMVVRLKSEIDEAEAPVIATGGFASLMSQITDSINFVDPMLVLRGLWIIASRN